MFFYLIGLLLSIGGLLLLDRHGKLAFWHDRARTWKVIGLSLGIFVAWDITNIAFGVFLHGDSPYQLPFVLLPEFPLEEIGFLFLLIYTTLIVWRKAETWHTPIS